MKKILATIFSATLCVLPAMVMAQGITSDLSNLGLNEFETSTNLGTNVALIATIARLINIILGFLGVLVVVGILYGGFKRMTAAGNEDQISSGNKIMGAGIVGLVIVLAAYAIAAFVVNQLTDATGYNQ